MDGAKPQDYIKEEIRQHQEIKAFSFKEQLKNIGSWAKKIAALNLDIQNAQAEHLEYDPEPPVRLILADEKAAEVFHAPSFSDAC